MSQSINDNLKNESKKNIESSLLSLLKQKNEIIQKYKKKFEELKIKKLGGKPIKK